MRPVESYHRIRISCPPNCFREISIFTQVAKYFPRRKIVVDEVLITVDSGRYYHNNQP